MTDKNKIIKDIVKHERQIKRYGVKRIGIFGSFAKSLQKKNSDLDVLVEFERGKKTFDNYIELKFYLNSLFKRKIDLVVKESLKSRIKKKVLEEVEYA